VVRANCMPIRPSWICSIPTSSLPLASTIMQREAGLRDEHRFQSGDRGREIWFLVQQLAAHPGPL